MKATRLFILAICLLALGQIAMGDEKNTTKLDPVKAPPIAVVAPAGGEHFLFESKTEVMWALSAIKPTEYQILLSMDGGLTYPEKLATLTGGQAAATSWVWKPVKPAGDNLRIKVVAKTEKQSYDAISQAFSVVAPPTRIEGGHEAQINAASPPTPLPGEAVPTPAPVPGHPSPAPDKVSKATEITANSAGGSPPPAGGGEAIPSQPPVPGGPAPKAIELTTPNGGEVWSVGEKVRLAWRCSAPQETFSLHLSTDDGKTYEPIATKISGKEFTYTWTVKADVSKLCRMKVVGASAATVVMEDVSDSAFEIAAKVKKDATAKDVPK